MAALQDLKRGSQERPRPSSRRIYTAQVASAGAFEYVPTYEVYFKGERAQTLIVLPPDGLTFESASVAEISDDLVKPNAVSLRASIGEVCRQLGIKTRKILNDKKGIVLEADPGKRGLVRGELVHLGAGVGWVDLKKTAGEATEPSPKLSTILPQLAGDAQAIFAAKPKLESSLSPLTEVQMNETSQDSAAAGTLLVCLLPMVAHLHTSGDERSASVLDPDRAGKALGRSSVPPIRLLNGQRGPLVGTVEALLLGG